MATAPDLTPLPGNLGRRWCEKYPEIGTGPVPIAPAISPEWFRLERDHVFRTQWLNVGTLDEIPQPGDYIVREIHCAKVSLIVIRAEDGGVHAFHNVCRHRGNKLVWEYKGRAPGCLLTCRFHGFSYDPRGVLQIAPAAENFSEPLVGRLNLQPVHCDQRAGFIFVNLAPQPEESLKEFLAPIADHLADYPFQGLPQRYHYQSYQRSNWKLALDAQSEVYHVRFLHGQSWPNLFTSQARPYCESFSIELHDRHRYGNWPGNPHYDPRDVERFALAEYASITRLARPRLDIGARINTSAAPDWGFDIIHMFPNTNILVLPNVWHTHQFWPIAHDRMLWEVKIHMPAPRSAGERFSDEYARVLLRDALREDGTTHEHTQQALESGAIDAIHLQDEEVFVRHAYWAIEQEIHRHQRGTRQHIRGERP